MPEPTTVPRTRKPRPGARAGSAAERAAGSTSDVAPAPIWLGKYELLFEIGRGGMGSVHAARARDAHGLERIVALKRLPRERATKDALAALAAEAKITSTIDHPNVVDTFEFGVEAGDAYLAMRLIEGVPLSRAIELSASAGERIPPALAAWIVGQAARGLHAAHALTTKGGERFPIVHRDVSPANLLVSREGRVYVVDFGIAKLLANDIRTVSGVIKGKFAYMSPEQTQGSDVDARSDLFSLGVVLYELLTGVSPFLAGNPAESIYRINHVDPAPVTALAPEVPDAIANVVRRCLARTADERFASAAELADALRSAARSSGQAVDESDVAAWIERVAGDDLRALRDRIAAAARRPASPAPPPSATTPVSEPPSLPSTIDVRRERPSRPWIYGALALAAAGAIGLTFALTRGPGATGADARGSDARGAAADVSSGAASVVASTAPPAPSSGAPPDERSSATSRAAPDATVTALEPSSTARPAASAPGEPARPRPAPSAAPSVAPAKSSHKGEPFRTLGG